MIDTKKFLEDIDKRKLKLEFVTEKLKEKFVGIDNIIDEFIRNVKLWYLMPELQMRPLIVNLWGPTGCGKTDLIRTFVSLIECNNKFVEIQMDATETYMTKIQQYLYQSDIDEIEPSILFLDEMQRFRTIAEDGVPMKQDKFTDLWMLLSDGKFESSSRNRSDLMDMVLESIYYKDYEIAKGGEESSEIEIQKRRLFKTPLYQAKRMKTLLKLEYSIEEIMKWSEEEKLNLLMNALKNDKLFEGNCYTKMIIFISGNLDEAYFMSGDVNNADVDADIYHNHSLRINITDIKAALSLRFKPEQVSRFGNIHLIYPCLNKKNYEEIICRRLEIIKNKIFSSYNLTVEFDNSINEIIYSNGVFPAQGVRPLLSTLNHILETSLPLFIYNSIKDNITEFKLSFDNGLLWSEFKEKVSCKVPLIIDDIKKDKNIDDIALASVHEMGHALVYALVFGIAPTQIIGRTSSTDYAGFIGTHSKFYSKNSLKQDIIVSLAGQAAEEIVFTETHKSFGSAEDIKKATSYASNYVRTYGFDGFQSHITIKTSSNGNLGNFDIDSTNSIIEQMLQSCKHEAKSIITENIKVFKKLVSTIINNNGEMRNEEFTKILSEFDINVKVVNPKFKIIDDYNSKLISFL